MTAEERNDPFSQVLTNVHEGVRKSRLVKALYEKISDLPPGSFPFAVEFGRLRDIIAPQIGDTRILFPEFTPHDESLHVVKLFQIADKFFGDTFLHLSAAELFLLACALYAHDWGMAVSQAECDFIRNGARDQPGNSFTPLEDERERVAAFIGAEGLLSSAPQRSPTLDDKNLRLYVRQTHARRSGARVRAHFFEWPAVGHALAHLCEGHWHDFATLDDPNRFPRDREIASQPTNLLALALQIRLIDLFHITDDRTPYALWRFVSPRDSRSEIEWKKHRALHGLSVTEFSPGRAIKIEGFTEDEEVWAGLQDLRRYCEDQVARTWELSARNVPQRYKLDILKVNWDVPTGILRPVNLSFSFDNSAMFRILSDDIYDGDPYVFLRELLQNAIDAIRTRKLRHEQRAQGNISKKRTFDKFDTTIYFSATHLTNGDIVVSCRDFGIGMDEHIVRNYFAVAGVSYYRSDEFRRQHLGFEPISRFGIGILSCFMVAKSLNIKTYRDPECGSIFATSDMQLSATDAHRARRLQLQVPSVERQFVVKDLNEDFDVGTEVTLCVEKQKVAQRGAKGIVHDRKRHADESRSDAVDERTLRITEYLCTIAGFVESPILVEESIHNEANPTRILILHPDRDAEVECSHFENAVVVHQLRREYPWSEVTSPESVSLIDETMNTHHFELSELMPAKGYSGWVVYPMPKDDLDFAKSEHGAVGESIALRHVGEPKWLEPQIYWQEHETKAQSHAMFSVYRDGILLTNIREANQIRRSDALPRALIKINLISSDTAPTNVSRTSLAAADHWETEVWKAIIRCLSETRMNEALATPPQERLYRIGRLASVYGLKEDDIAELVPNEKRISIWLTASNGVEFREGPFDSCTDFPIAPPHANEQILCLVAERYGFKFDTNDDSIWEGPDSLVRDIYLGTHQRGRYSLPLRMGQQLSKAWLKLVILRLQFLRPPAGYAELIPQLVYMPAIKDKTTSSGEGSLSDHAERQNRIHASLTRIVSQIERIQPREIQDLTDVIFSEDEIPIPFASPFESKFATRRRKYNAEHPVGREILRALAACILEIRQNKSSLSMRREFFQLQVPGYSVDAEDERALLTPFQFALGLFAIVVKYDVIPGFKPPELPDEVELVPEMPAQNSDEQFNANIDIAHSGRRYGKLISTWPM